MRSKKYIVKRDQNIATIIVLKLNENTVELVIMIYKSYLKSNEHIQKLENLNKFI
jgi:hypothetical protein